MRPLPPIEQVLPVFQSSFDAVLSHTAKASFITACALPIIGGVFAAPLLAATQFGNDREAENSIYVKYGLTPLASIGIATCSLGLVASGMLAVSVIVDLAHKLVFARHAISYRYIFFPFKFNFIDYNALIK